MAKSQLKGLDKFEPANLPDILTKLYAYDYGGVDEEQEEMEQRVENAVKQAAKGKK